MPLRRGGSPSSALPPIAGEKQRPAAPPAPTVILPSATAHPRELCGTHVIATLRQQCCLSCRREAGLPRATGSSGRAVQSNRGPFLSQPP